MRPNTPEDFWARTEPNGDCLLWTSTMSTRGYGVFWYKNKQHFAHRLAFFFRMGRWPSGLLRLLCYRPDCVLHVVEGTSSENALDTVASGRHPHANKTHCRRGHPFDDANTYHWGGTRLCRMCRRERGRVTT